MKDEHQKRGIVYCRVSSAEQVDGTSLESQERFCGEYTKREKIDLLRVFKDEGESAKTADRTEFSNAIAFCADRKNKVDYFIVYKLDRFARNQYDHSIVKHKLKSYGTQIRSVTEKIDDTSAGKFMEGMLSVVAEFDNNVRTERSVGGMRERIRQGIWVWQAPMGYYRPQKGSNLVIDPETAPFIKAVFTEYAKGSYTYESLADHLATQGYRTRKNRFPIPQLIEKILKNPLYCGVIKALSEEHRGAFEALIDQELFDLCQEGRKRKAHIVPRTAKNPHFPLRKLAVCSSCHQPLTASRSTGRHGKKYAYYHHQKQECEKAKFITSEKFEKAFIEYLHSITPSIDYEKAFKAIVIDIWKTNYEKLDEENAKTRKDIAKLEESRQRIFEMHQRGVYSDGDFIFQKSVVNKQLDQKHRLLIDKRIEEFNMEEALAYCFDLVRNTPAKWKGFEYAEKVRFQKMIFDGNVEFDGTKFGTALLSLVYKGNQEYQNEKSTLVTPRGIEPRFQP